MRRSYIGIWEQMEIDINSYFLILACLIPM